MSTYPTKHEAKRGDAWPRDLFGLRLRQLEKGPKAYGADPMANDAGDANPLRIIRRKAKNLKAGAGA